MGVPGVFDSKIAQIGWEFYKLSVNFGRKAIDKPRHLPYFFFDMISTDMRYLLNYGKRVELSKNRVIIILLFVVLCGRPYMAPAHKIYMKDESVIRSDTVWEQTLGYFLDEVSLYAYKKAGMPERLVKRLTPLRDQLIRSKERLLQLITQQIGAEALRTYLPTIEKYLVEEKVVSYDKFGDTIHLERSKVKRIEYSKPLPPIAPGLIDPQDMETRRAIEAEKALLYE